CAVAGPAFAKTPMAADRGVLLLCVGKLVLLWVVHDVAGDGCEFQRGRDGRVRFAAVSDGDGRQSGGWRRERTHGDSLWPAKDVSRRDGGLRRGGGGHSAGDELRAWTWCGSGAGDGRVRDFGPDAAIGVGDVHESGRLVWRNGNRDDEYGWKPRRMGLHGGVRVRGEGDGKL